MKYNSTLKENEIEIFQEPIPEGDYTLGVDSTKQSQTKTRDYMVKIVCQVLEGQYVGRKIIHHIIFPNTQRDDKGKAAFSLVLAIRFLKAINEPCEGAFEIRHENWPGKKFGAFVSREPYNGKVYNKVKYVYPIGREVGSLKSREDLPEWALHT